MNVVLLGAPGAGKGTQAEFLAKRLDIPHVASGDLFRANLNAGTRLGLMAKSYMERGVLVPDDVVIDIVLDRIRQPDCAQGVLLDGFPRTQEQAEALDVAMAGEKRQIDVVPYIKVSPEVLLARMSGRVLCKVCQTPYHLVFQPPKVMGRCDNCGGELYQRPDDQMETARKRLDVFFQQTEPLIAYYERRGILRTVDGERSVTQVYDSLVSVILSAAEPGRQAEAAS